MSFGADQIEAPLDPVQSLPNSVNSRRHRDHIAADSRSLLVEGGHALPEVTNIIG